MSIIETNTGKVVLKILSDILDKVTANDPTVTPPEIDNAPDSHPNHKKVKHKRQKVKSKK